MKVAICDDDLLELDKIKNTVHEFSHSTQIEHEIAIEAFSDGSELLNFINHSAPFDIIVLDIVMPVMNGIDVAAEIRKTNNDCKIIFLTSSPEFAVNSYKVNAFYYLLKPFKKPELLSLLDRAAASLRDEQPKSIVIKEKNGLLRLPLHTIEYVESVKHTLNFHLSGGETASCYAKMEEFRELLLADSRFIQCHQSFIVNMSKIAQVTNKYFVLQDKTVIPISRAAYPQVKQAYVHHFFNEVKNR